MTTRRAIVLASVLACLAAAAGCEREQPTQVAPRGGVIRGIVSDGAAIESEFTVLAETIGAQDQRVSIATYCGLDGRFELSVPNGKYRVSVAPGCGWSSLFYDAAGPVLSADAADTVVVAGDEQEVTFACGRVDIDIALPASLRGQTTYCGVQPVADPRRQWECRTVAADGLHLALRFVPPGAHHVVLATPGGPGIYLPPTFEPKEADVIEVVAGQEVAYSAAIDAMTTISGTVTGSWQVFGLTRPRVTVYCRDDYLRDAQVADDGSFTFAFLAGGPLRLRVWITPTEHWLGGHDFDSATVFDVEAGEALTGIDYVESGLECVLTGDLDDLGASITVYDGSGNSLGSSSFDGDTLRISNLQPGPAYVRLRPWSDQSLWLMQYFDRRDSLAVADPIMIPGGGQIASVAPVLVRGGRIRGRLLDVLGLPPSMSYVRMALYAADDSVGALHNYYLWRDIYDEVTGDYMLNQIPDGTYKLCASTKELWTWWPHQPSFAAAGVVTVEDHAEVTGVDLRLLY